MTPEERTARQKQLNAWRDARRANLSFPHGREMTQEQMDEQRRLQREQERTRLALAESDAARAKPDTHRELQLSPNAGDPLSKSEEPGGRGTLSMALGAAQKASAADPLGRATADREMNQPNHLHAEQDKAREALKAFDGAHGHEAGPHSDKDET